MKKSLVLAMAMALGVTASAYAANPFSDVPAGHWAYDSIDKLAAAGVVDGMGDGTFQGDRTMTRYEMAQIVAKAMAKGANVDKLAAEFADELDALGVRVANLEKKADNVTITGQIRYQYENKGGKSPAKSQNLLRSRLFLNGQINEDWAYHARLQNDVNIDDGAKDDGFSLNQAYVTGKLGGVKVTAGKADVFIANGNFYDDTMEAIQVAYGKKAQLSAFVGDADTLGEKAKINGAAIGTKLFKLVDVKGEVTRVNPDNDRAFNVWDAAVNVELAKHVNLDYTWIDSSADGKSSIANVVGLSYKGATNDSVGSWGLWARYYNQGQNTYLAHTMNYDVAGDFADGFKGFGIGASYALAKNMVYFVEYYDIEAKHDSSDKQHVLFNRLQFCF